MPILFHLSDLHFGPKFNEHLAELILKDIQASKPDVVIVSGDWTMRGRVSEYEKARVYLLRLPQPVFTIPGNHDQPLHWGGMIERLVRPWARYKRYIKAETDSVFQSPGLFIIGLNDNHNIIPGGIWTSGQRHWLEGKLRGAPPGSCKILVMHHHLLWEGKIRPAGQYFPTHTLSWLGGLDVELVLNGHTHVPIVRETPQGIVVAQSGTTLSGRTRQGYGNTYNRIEVGGASIDVTTFQYDTSQDCFAPHNRSSFPRRYKGIK